MDNINLDKLIKPDELDYNMILSVPEEIGQKLQRIIQGNATPEEKSTTNIQIIESNDNMDNLTRKLIFKLNDTLLPMTIVDLPSIIEAKKTIDYKTFYKSSDISQMMFVHDKEYKLSSEVELENFNPFKRDHIFNKITWKKDPDHPFKLKHGLSKSTRNIRARRFKRKNRYNEEEMRDVCKKLKSIIDVSNILVNL
jgi:TATA-binding protein-associated factor Taf7